MRPFEKFCCSHPVTTEPDEKGQGLCLRCGVLLQLRLTADVFDRFRQAVMSGRVS